MKLTTFDDEGDEVEIPAMYAVCERCRGEGHHTNPAIDGNGLTSDDMDELGDDFREDYMSGVYDIRCEVCNGERLVLVPDPRRCTPEQLALYERRLQDEYEYRQEAEMERRMGA